MVSWGSSPHTTVDLHPIQPNEWHLAFVPPTTLPPIPFIESGLRPTQSLVISNTLNSAISYRLISSLNFPCTPSQLHSLSVICCRVLEVAIRSPLSDRGDVIDRRGHQKVAALSCSLSCVLHHLVPNVDLSAVSLPAVCCWWNHLGLWRSLKVRSAECWLRIIHVLLSMSRNLSYSGACIEDFLKYKGSLLFAEVMYWTPCK